VRIASRRLPFVDDERPGRPLLISDSCSSDYGWRVDRETAQDWLNRYIDAWTSYDPDDVSALFSADVAYRYHPNDEPIVGRPAVVASWLGTDASGNASSRDAPGTFDAEYSPVAIDGDVVVATGRTRYRETPGGPVVRLYENCFIMRFDHAGQCREFTEFYMRRPQPGET
jgi:hypothetical protein